MFKLYVRIGLIFLLAIFLFFLSSFTAEVEKVDEVIPREKKHSGQGIYLTAWTAKTPVRLNHLINQARQTKINTFVIDAKEIISRDLLPLVKQKKLKRDTLVAPNAWLAKLTEQLHGQGFIITTRLVVFKDDHLVIARPDLGIKIKGKGEGEGGGGGRRELYRDLKWGRWADPYSEEVRLYNELIAEVAALSGVDEVQFDYVRFPAERRAHEAIYPFYNQELSRVEVINLFLKNVRERVSKYNVSIAVDIFGVTAWQSKKDIASLGQDLKQMAKYIDVLSPMFYPSHFHAGYDGFANPGSQPYYFMATGIKKTLEILSSEAVAVVPWLQGFDLKSPNFGPNYIVEQIKACHDQGATGYLIWNARNRYEVTFSALKSL